jgi:hypothetical protein
MWFMNADEPLRFPGIVIQNLNQNFSANGYEEGGGVQLFGLPNPLTSILWIFGWGYI